ncbi:peptide ABC transporter substrate-binding protein [Babesia ovata]|uniref:Peptide ABC transporter substrate-binding protein n=1 Tax=Babesia ovata TaxID=189622 RepID=A0A2H6K786_9APIC|nr:peptide ABC transporter substrate-binding protein [Babesia ovata]GBE58850.1 peptide ABC transporter substrate-binding protein [Babesia ovata]
MGSQFEWRVERSNSDELTPSRLDISERLDFTEFSSAVTVRAGSDEYTLTTARPTLSESFSSLPPEESAPEMDSASISSRRYAKSDKSDSSVVDHDIEMPGQPPSFDNRGRRQPPRKIIITLGAPEVLAYPFMRLSQCVCVIRFQKSADRRASPDGIYGSLFSFSNVFALVSPSAFSASLDLAQSWWRRHGIWGLYRGFPEYAGHKLLCDVMQFVVPRYIAPHLEIAVLGACKSVFNFGQGHLSHLRDRYAGVWGSSSVEGSYESDSSPPSAWTKNTFSSYLRRNFEIDAYDFAVQALVELFTYPVMTISSRAMTYDGITPMDTMSLVKGAIAHDGALSLYRGFFWRLLALLFQDMQKHRNRRVHQLAFNGNYSPCILDDAVPVFLDAGSFICQHISLVERCMSSMDGFCVETSTASLLSEFPWFKITTNMAITACMTHIRDRF